MGAVREFELAGWQDAAASYAGFGSVTRLFVDALLEAAHVARGTRLLDVACGQGITAGTAAAAGARVTGIDFSPAMLAAARATYPGLDLQHGDAEDLPVGDAAFEAVVANFGIHHVERPGRAIAEARRVLAPGGTFAFTFWPRPADNPPWRILFDAVAAHGRLDVPMPSGADGPATPENFSRLAVGAGFDAGTLRCDLIERTWRLPPDADLVAIFSSGTVRTATLLRGQSADALAAIRRHTAQALQEFRQGDAFALPVRAWLLSARAA
jgi:SAM-dependent methyltransferase